MTRQTKTRNLGLGAAALALVALTLALLLPKGSSADDAPAKDRAARVDAVVREAMTKAHVPGAIVGIWQDGEQPYLRAFGVADKRTGAPMRTDLHMRVGSVTKTFTVTALLQLVDAGRVGLDDPIGKYLEGVPNGNRVTLRELAEMRSGIPSYTESKAWAKRFLADPHRQWKPKRLLAYAFARKPLFPPGTAYAYSNTNIVLVGLVVEAVSGESLRAYLGKHILRPEHLTETSYPRDAELPSPYAHGYTAQTPNGKPVDATDYDPSFAGAAGAMVSTAADLHRWTVDLVSGKLLEPATQRQRERFLPIADAAGYGLGLFDANGWIGHDGSIPGYQTLAVHSPEQKATVVILVNTDVNPPKVELAAALGEAITSAVAPRQPFTFGVGG